MKIIAHRGASGTAPENTMPAFELGWSCGSDGVEMDLRLTADGRVAVIHDPSTGRTGDVDLVVADSTLEELRVADVGGWKGDEYAGTRVPELSEVLRAAPTGRELVLELKIGAEIFPVMRELVTDAGNPEEDLVIISFNESVFEAKSFFPNARAYFLESDPVKLQASIARSAEAGLDGLDIAWNLVDESVMEAAKAAGLDIYVWTVDDVEVAKRMRDLGVSGLTTNQPELMLKELAK